MRTSTLVPFDPDLNSAILKITDCLMSGFEVSDTAPSSCRALKEHLDAGKTMVVAREGSECTIFGDPKVNFAFRAWHDWCHWVGEFDFSVHGERAACNMQIEHIYQFFGVTEQTRGWAQILVAEVIGQRKYYEKYGAYVSDQRAFARAYLADGDASLERQW